MNSSLGVALIGLLLVGPVVSRAVEERIEIFFLAIGILAMTLAGAWSWEVVGRAARVPLEITLTVIVTDIALAACEARWTRAWMDTGAGLAPVALRRGSLRDRSAVRDAYCDRRGVDAVRVGRTDAPGAAGANTGHRGWMLCDRLRLLADTARRTAFDASRKRFGDGVRRSVRNARAVHVLPGMLACAIVAGQFARPRTKAREPARRG